LGYIDLNKASRQDVEMLKKLVVEFKDELDALGVRVDELGDRVDRLHNRLGGWRITGVLRHDIGWTSSLGNDSIDRGWGHLARARVFFDRWFGPEENMRFQMRIDPVSTGGFTNTAATDRNIRMNRFFVEFPFGNGARFIVGRYYNDDLEQPYYLDGTTLLSDAGSFYGNSFMLDRAPEVFALQQSLGWSRMGQIYAHIASSAVGPNYQASAMPAGVGGLNLDGARMWEVYGFGKLQFTENVAIDLGAQTFWGADDADLRNTTRTITDPTTGFTTTVPGPDYKLNYLWTLFGGLRFDFTNAVSIKGMYYYQNRKVEQPSTGVELLADNVAAWKVIIDAKQELLRFTSLWLEYSQIDRGFWFGSGQSALFNDGDYSGAARASSLMAPGGVVVDNIDLMRLAARQRWNDRWATYLFYTRYQLDLADAAINQLGLGVSYRVNPSVIFALTYNQFVYDDVFNKSDEGSVRLRTQVTF